jgi:hypothetical protein
LIVRISDRELRARSQASAERKQEQSHRENQGSPRRPVRDPRVMPFARWNAPIDVDWDSCRGIFWSWRSHEIFGAANLSRTE